MKIVFGRKRWNRKIRSRWREGFSACWPIQVAGRLFGVLEFLADAGSAGLMEISAALDLNKTTVHRVLNSLIYMGYARQNAVNGRYEPTFKVVDIANRIMGKVDIVQIVRPYLRKLMEETGETVHFVERDGIDAVYIDKVESLNNGIQMVSRIGSRIPLYWGGRRDLEQQRDRPPDSLYHHGSQ